MPDARLNTSLTGHPKTKKLIRRLGHGAAWSLVCLILWTRENRPTGDLDGMTAEDIELACDWTGENDALVAEMVSVGFLDQTDAGYRLHDWADHQPWSVGENDRSDRARWAALCRQHGRARAAEIMPEYAKRLLKAANSTDESANSTDLASDLAAKHEKTAAPSPSPSPSPSPRSKDIPTPDGVGVDTGGKSPASSPPPPAPSPPLPPSVEEPPPDPPPTTACPVGKIVALYHAKLPMCPKVEKITKMRRGYIQARWREDLPTLEAWENYFADVAKSPFLTGRSSGSHGRPPFVADLEWLTRPSNFAKVAEGRYHRV